MMRNNLCIGIVIVLLLSTLVFYVHLPIVDADGFGGDYPPPGIGDWIINTDTYVGNETIILNGNLTVEPGATLIFRNVTLIMNSTTNGEYHIEVKSFGSFYIYDLDNDNTTTDDTSNITAYNPSLHYLFWVNANANFTMKNCELHECGDFGIIGYSPPPKSKGLFIRSDSAIIDHCNLSNNYVGVTLYNSNAIVSNNTISWSDIGIFDTWWSNGTIENNVISWSDTYGIWVSGWDNTERKTSNPLIKNNTIYKTARDGLGGVGIQITAFSNPTIDDTRIIDWGEDAIYFGQWCQAIVNNCTFDAQGGNYALASSSCRNATVINSTIEDNNVLWDLSLATAYFKMTNCTFNQSKVIFQGTDSNLTVNWFLNTYVNDTSGNPISNANIRIRDNANGTFDQNYTADVNGFLNWTVLKEYFQKDNNGDKDGEDVGERIDYSPYNVSVEKNGYFSNYTLVQMNESKYITITLQVDEKPEINYTPVTSANIGELINITANIMDDVSVDAVYLNYTDVHGINQNMTMNKWDGNYSFDIPGQDNTGFVDYFIWCNDTTGNDNQTITYQIQINDITDPEINHVSITSANISETINITANVTDDVSVSSVNLNYTGVNGASYNVSMQKWDGNYSYEIPRQNTIGNIQYFIWANDSDGNDNRTIGYSIQINDVVKPEINHVPVLSANIGELINITVNVTDDVDVDKVYLNYTEVEGNNYNVSMYKYNNNWSYDIPGQVSAGVIEYFIWCNDTSGNANLTGINQIQINEVIIPDTTPPTIVSTSPTGVNVSITTTITITFNESMNISSVQNAITTSPAITISSYSWNADNTTLTITPTGNLSYNSTYNITVGIGAKDIAGNGLENPYSWEFTTELHPITNGPSDGGIGEYWWVILINIMIVIIIVLALYWRLQREEEKEEQE